MIEATLQDLGVCDYQRVYDLQLELVAKRRRDEVCDTLLLVEHPAVITVGRKREARHNVLSPGSVPVVEVERGGDATYHGPGQLVAYPIIMLRPPERDLHLALRNLEQTAIDALSRWNLAAERNQGNTGVWVNDKKIASIGIACRGWVLFHGIALNVSTNLHEFDAINPCGFESSIMTSIEEQLTPHAAPPMLEVKATFSRCFQNVFGREFNNLAALGMAQST